MRRELWQNRFSLIGCLDVLGSPLHAIREVVSVYRNSGVAQRGRRRTSPHEQMRRWARMLALPLLVGGGSAASLLSSLLTSSAVLSRVLLRLVGIRGSWQRLFARVLASPPPALLVAVRAVLARIVALSGFDSRFRRAPALVSAWTESRAGGDGAVVIPPAPPSATPMHGLAPLLADTVVVVHRAAAAPSAAAADDDERQLFLTASHLVLAQDAAVTLLARLDRLLRVATFDVATEDVQLHFAAPSATPEAPAALPQRDSFSVRLRFCGGDARARRARFLFLLHRLGPSVVSRTHVLESQHLFC